MNSQDSEEKIEPQTTRFNSNELDRYFGEGN